MTEIRAQRGPWYHGVELRVTEQGSVGRIVFEPIAPNYVLPVTTHIDDAAAQVLMDDLWASGFRPTEGTGSAGSLQATQAHLKDMRKLVAKALKVEL